jgi:hypothetical protein
MLNFDDYDFEAPIDIDPDNCTLEEYVVALVSVLKWWDNVHHDADFWFNWWFDFCDADVRTRIEWNGPYTGNAFFDYNLLEGGLRVWCEENVNHFSRCGWCGEIVDTTVDIECECVTEDGKDPDELELYDITEHELYDYMTDLYDPDKEWGQDGLLELLTDWQLEQGARTYCWEAFAESTHPHTEGIEEEITQAIEDIEWHIEDDDPTELYLALTYANHICHVGGNIVVDYGGEGLYDVVDRVSQEGFEWIEREYQPTNPPETLCVLAHFPMVVQLALPELNGNGVLQHFEYPEVDIAVREVEFA